MLKDNICASYGWTNSRDNSIWKQTTLSGCVGSLETKIAGTWKPATENITKCVSLYFKERRRQMNLLQ